MYKQQNHFFIVSCLWRTAKPKHPAVTALLLNNRPSYFFWNRASCSSNEEKLMKEIVLLLLSSAQPRTAAIQEISQINYFSFIKNCRCRTRIPVWDLPEQPFPCRLGAGCPARWLEKGCQWCPSALTSYFPSCELDFSEPVFPAFIFHWVWVSSAIGDTIYGVPGHSECFPSARGQG